MFRYLQHAAFVSSGGPLSDQVTTGTILQLSRVQSLEFDFDFPYANEVYLDDRFHHEQLERAVVNFSFEYLATAGKNERRIGMVLDNNSNAFARFNQEKNYYFQSAHETVDMNLPNSSPTTIIGIGHAVLNGYSIMGSVGSLLRVTCAGQGLNAVVYTGVTGDNVPSIDTVTAEPINAQFALPVAQTLVFTGDPNEANNIVALGSRDLRLTFPTGSAFGTIISGDGCILQSFNLAFSLDRQEAKCLGHAYPSERPISGPIHISLSVEAVVNQFNLARLSDMRCEGHDINILVNQPCSDSEVFGFRMRGLRLESQSVGRNLDGYQTITFNWEGMTSLRDEYVTMSGAATADILEAAFERTLEWYWYDDFEGYPTGTQIEILPDNYTYIITGGSGVATGIFSGLTTGYFSYGANYAFDHFESYATGENNGLYSGIDSGALLFNGYITSAEHYAYDDFERYAVGDRNEGMTGISSGIAVLGTGRVVDASFYHLYAMDEFEVYAAGSISTLNAGVNSGVTWRDGTITLIP